LLQLGEVINQNMCGYHPQISDLVQLGASWGRILQVGCTPLDLELDVETRVLTRAGEDPQLPPGIYWATTDGVTDALVLHGSGDLSTLPEPAQRTTLAEASENDLGPAGLNWLEVAGWIGSSSPILLVEGPSGSPFHWTGCHDHEAQTRPHGVELLREDRWQASVGVGARP
jgi:hypothetical protein